MAQIRRGTVVEWRQLSPILGQFRIKPEDGSGFPDYKPGQYMALRRDSCRLTRRMVGQDGRPQFVPDLDAAGRQKLGPVTHSYSISSAPHETRDHGFLEFYVVFEEHEGLPGRLTESLFQMRPGQDDRLEYVDRIVGDFTLDRRAAGFASVLLVGTGSGLAPFASMLKQLHNEAPGGRGVRYTLLHANRTREELGYHERLREIEASGRLDFVYLPSVSRPTDGDRREPRLGIGRANNLLRHVLELPLKEEEDLRSAESGGSDPSAARAALASAVKPVLPRHLSAAALRARLDPAETVVLTCGNPELMADVRAISGARGMRFEKEDW